MKPIAPWQALAHVLSGAPELDDIDWMLLGDDLGFSLRPDQHIPKSFRYCGFLAGRGWGKSFAIAPWINKQVESGKIKSIALMAQDEERTLALQAQALIASSPLWNKAELYKESLIWPNGAEAKIYTPVTPGKIRGFNGQLAWLSEFVAWPPPTRKLAFTNALTATREGNAQVIWDTTSQGRNDLIAYMMQLHNMDPVNYPVFRGTIWNNPMFSREYLREQRLLYTGQRAEEELEGKVFDEAEGASWKQEWIERARVQDCPRLERSIIGLDPGISTKPGVDGTGLIIGGRLPNDGDIYVFADKSAVLSPEQYASLILDAYRDGLSVGLTGAIVETNRGGETIAAVIRAVAQDRKIEVRMLGVNDEFPLRTQGVLYLKEVHNRGNKFSRGVGPSALYSQGRVHHVGTFAELELEQCTYAPEAGTESPNRYDAANMMLTELAALNSDRPMISVRREQVAGLGDFHSLLRDRLRAMRSRSVS